MNELQRGVLVLIKSVIDNKASVLPPSFSLEAVENLILKHQIVGLAYEGAALCGISKKEPVMQRLFQKYYQQILWNERQISALDRLFAAFEANDIAYLPVKGLEMKRLFPNPAMRTMGDADVLIRMEQYDRIRPIMLELGYVEGQQTNHELLWDCDSLHLELHKQLVPSDHPDLQRYYGDGWKLAKPLKGNRFTYSVEDMYIFLFAHFVKHYRRSGIGLRHVLDIWLYRKENPAMDMKYVRSELEKLRLCEFHDNICALIDYWFHGAVADEKTEYISEVIFNSGSWGSRANHMRFIAMKQKKTGKDGSLARIMPMFFPGVQAMKNRFPILEKVPWLLPILWPVRWVTAVLFRRENIRRVQNNLEYQSEKAVSEYEQSLHYVGLHYDV